MYKFLNKIKNMNTNNKFEQELLQFFSKYNYITKDEEDDYVTLWEEKPIQSKYGYWQSDANQYLLNNFNFSEFENKDWKECILTLNPNMEQIEELETNKKQIQQYLLDIDTKLNCVDTINNEVDLTEYQQKLVKEKLVNETQIDIIDVKIYELRQNYFNSNKHL